MVREAYFCLLQEEPTFQNILSVVRKSKTYGDMGFSLVSLLFRRKTVNPTRKGISSEDSPFSSENSDALQGVHWGSTEVISPAWSLHSSLYVP